MIGLDFFFFFWCYVLWFLSSFPAAHLTVHVSGSCLLEYSTLVLLPPNFSAGRHTLTLSWPCCNAFFHNPSSNHSMTSATPLLWASSDTWKSLSLSFLIYFFDVDLALWLLGMGEIIFAQESTLPPHSLLLPASKIKQTLLSIHLVIFIGFWEASSQTPLSVTILIP